MSKEMKKKLREEYTGFGGAENKVNREGRGRFRLTALD